MKVKLDENLPDDLVKVLESQHHDVETVPSESLTGQPDPTIFAAAQNEQRILFTQDLDFSDIRQFKPGAHAGVVLIRLRHPSRHQLIERIRSVVQSQSIESWIGCFVVITDHKLRVRRP
jgi:predicted nuclease of predicted toxin-antitoxin system